MSDIAALAGLSQRGYEKAWDEIPATLGTILNQKRARTVEQDALEIFKDGFDYNTFQSFARKYPNVPQAELLGVAAQIGKQSEAQAMNNAGASLISAWAKDKETITNYAKLKKFVEGLGLSPRNKVTFMTKILPGFLQQYGLQLKEVSQGASLEQIDPISGERIKTVKEPSYAPSSRATSAWEDFKTDYLKRKPNAPMTEIFAAYKKTGQRPEKPSKPTDFDKKWGSAKKAAATSLKREPTEEEIAAKYKTMFGQESLQDALVAILKGQVGVPGVRRFTAGGDEVK